MAKIRARGSSAEQAAHDEALRQWEANTARVRAECGVDDAKAAERAAPDVVWEMQALVIETPAQTRAGLIFKAKYAAKCDHDPDVMTSIVDDLLAMAEDA